MDQPHILVTGDAWQYVPFGRARLKSLRATGLSYASQSYTVDGTTIKVRIVGDQSFIQIDGDPTLYCESGQLFWPFRPRYSPLWGEAATWAFMDIPTTGKYLGKVKTGKDGRGDQVNTPKLSNGMRSKSIGWPLADLGNAPANETKDKETQEKYFDYTMTKKKAVSTFPASLFSGKMRLFMQSLYGAKEPNPDNPEAYFPLVLDDLDAPTVLSLRSSLEGGAMLIARSDSMGIFTAPDDTYWLLDINEGPRNILVNRINTTKASALVKQLKTMSADERTKAEAYIFANSEIEIPKTENTVYATGTFPGVVGAPMSYGWKWSESGSKASIVVHEQLGETIIETRWHARTVHLTFSYTAAADGKPAHINVSGTVEDHNDWIDGWGEYNIFVPGIPPVLDLYTLRAGSGLIPPDIPFPPTPIYGWYSGETWQPVTLENRGSLDVIVESWSNLSYPNGASPHPTTNPWASGATDGCTAWNAGYLETTTSGGRIVSFAATTVDGLRKHLSGLSETGGTSVGDDNTAWTGPGSFWLGQWAATDGGGGRESSSFFNTLKAAQSGSPHTFYQRNSWGTCNRTRITTEGDEQTKFAIVIPRGDAEALYIPKLHISDVTDTTRSQTNYAAHGVHVFAFNTTTQTEIPAGDGAGWIPPAPSIVDAGTTDYWQNEDGLTVYGPPATVDTTVEPRPPSTYTVLCFNSKVKGLEGEPGGSYAGLFDVDYHWPQYDRGMYTFTSYGGRYIMSEAPSNPTSITWHNFVGWA